MARTIWKYPLELIDRQEIKVPAGAELLSVGTHEHRLTLWAAVDPSRTSNAVRTIVIVGTDETMSEGILRFVGTAPLGSFVWHVFEG
jgi:hypothetical protein